MNFPLGAETSFMHISRSVITVFNTHADFQVISRTVIDEIVTLV